MPHVCALQTLGLSGVALESSHCPAWPTYPNKMTESDVSDGLVAPNAGAVQYDSVIRTIATLVTVTPLLHSLRSGGAARLLGRACGSCSHFHGGHECCKVRLPPVPRQLLCWLRAKKACRADSAC